jgi:hypothetical protein
MAIVWSVVWRLADMTGSLHAPVTPTCIPDTHCGMPTFQSPTVPSHHYHFLDVDDASNEIYYAKEAQKSAPDDTYTRCEYKIHQTILSRNLSSYMWLHRVEIAYANVKTCWSYDFNSVASLVSELMQKQGACLYLLSRKRESWRSWIRAS